MKKVISKKLLLSKIKIADLSQPQQQQVKGGASRQCTILTIGCTETRHISCYQETCIC